MQEYLRWLDARIAVYQKDCEKFDVKVNTTKNSDAVSLYRALSIEFAQKVDILETVKTKFISFMKGK